MDMQGVQDTISYISRILKQAKGDCPLEQPDVSEYSEIFPWLKQTKDETKY